MKMRISDRIGIVLLALVGLASAALLGFCAYNVWRDLYASPFYIGLASPLVNEIVYAAAALIVLILAIRALLLGFRRGEKVDKGSVAVQHTEQGNGEVRVSVQALDALVKQAIVGHNEGVADIKTRIVNHEDSVSVKIEMSLNGDVHIPNLTMLLQSSIKNFIEEFSGIAVRDVSIMVTTIIPVNPQLALATGQAAPESVVIEERPAAPALETAAESAPAEQEEPPQPEEPAAPEEPAPYAEPEAPASYAEPEEPVQEPEPEPLPEEESPAPEDEPAPEEGQPAAEEEPLPAEEEDERE